MFIVLHPTVYRFTRMLFVSGFLMLQIGFRISATNYSKTEQSDHADFLKILHENRRTEISG